MTRVALFVVGILVVVGACDRPLAPVPQPSTTVDSPPPNVVVNVVDGDTVDVETDTGKIRVRIIGIDTPETRDPRKPVQCFGPEATQNAKEDLLNKNVELEHDPSQDTVDRYGRYLYHIRMPDHKLYGEEAIRDGFARSYIYNNVPHMYASEYEMAEDSAQSRKLGVWSPQCTTN